MNTTNDLELYFREIKATIKLINIFLYSSYDLFNRVNIAFFEFKIELKDKFWGKMKLFQFRKIEKFEIKKKFAKSNTNNTFYEKYNRICNIFQLLRLTASSMEQSQIGNFQR